MQTVIIVIHLMIVIAMIAVILVQRSEGGALGIGGGGGGGGGMFSARGSANLLTRTTTILAVIFFITSLGLGILAKQQSGAPSILDLTGEDSAPAAGTALPNALPGEGTNLLDELNAEFGGTTAPPSDAERSSTSEPSASGTAAVRVMPSLSTLMTDPLWAGVG